MVSPHILSVPQTSAASKQKFANAVLFLLRACASEQPSLTSLLKMLFYVDFEHYRMHLRPVTGVRYVALERGPVVDGYKEKFSRLEHDGVVRQRLASVQGRRQKKQVYHACREPDLSVFVDTEIRVMKAVAQRCGASTGTELSDRTHLEGPWQFVWDSRSPGRPIPYVAFRWMDNLPGPEDLEAASRDVARAPVAAQIALRRRAAQAPSAAATTARRTKAS